MHRQSLVSKELWSGSYFRAVPAVQLGSEAGRRKMVHSSCFLSHARHVSGHLGGCKKAQGSMILTEGREEGIETSSRVCGGFWKQLGVAMWQMEMVCHRYPPPSPWHLGSTDLRGCLGGWRAACWTSRWTWLIKGVNFNCSSGGASGWWSQLGMTSLWIEAELCRFLGMNERHKEEQRWVPLLGTPAFTGRQERESETQKIHTLFWG